ncbi:PREDICTED: glutathione S-transferase T3-like [Brassica oleracea var. oleracea]|uniref:glutathione S-transferase T3-like n=1 Tax=Brassica oleracea var. oleracea TaxID=109376 RepID=UPI0006A6AD64|nr:PREDICTED: glutathione S-transferase T3-like [Brassica oleracea var. oleracea]
MGLFDATAASQWVAVVDDGKRQVTSLPVSFLSSAKGEISHDRWFCWTIRRRIRRWLSSRKGHGNLPICLFPLLGGIVASSISGESKVPLIQPSTATLVLAIVKRRTWTPADDVVLISLWLNTSKDPVVSTEQKSGTFWTRIAAYFAASHQDGGSEQRGASHCKHHWQKINDLVCKLCGAYEAARREKTSGQNENDVLKLAHQIFFNNHKKKFLLEHAWKELRHGQKWCELSSAKNEGTSKKKKAGDGGDSSTSQADSKKRPPGVKASKASGKKTFDPDKQVEEFERIWKIKQKEIDAKERLSKMSLLDSLIGKKELLLEYEESLKKKLINDLF